MTARSYDRMRLVWILLLAGSGAWISGLLVEQHARLSLTNAPAAGFLARMCQATERAGFSCQGALTSDWGEINLSIPLPTRDFSITSQALRIPVAFLGLAYFVFIGIWFAFVRPPVSSATGNRLPLATGLCGLGVSLVFLGVMALGRTPWCFWCLAVHALNVLLVFAIWRLGRARAHADVAASQAPVVAVLFRRQRVSAVVFALIVIAGLWIYRDERVAMRRWVSGLQSYQSLVVSLQEDPELLLREYYAQPLHRIPPRSGADPADDKAQLVVFIDFECSVCYCKSPYRQKQAVEGFDGRLAVSIRHFPLCNACNDQVTGEYHENACDAAYAAEAARLIGGEHAFWKMHNLLFKNRNNLDKTIYRELAVRIGLDGEQFVREMEGDAVRQIVEADIALATELGVTGTPTMFLNGRRITELCRGPVFWRAVAEAWASSESGGRDVADEIQGELTLVGASEE